MNKQNKLQNKTLKSGERTVVSHLEGLTYWQLSRYVASLIYIKKIDIVLDVGCGCGAGTFILAKKAKEIVGIDDSLEAINFAKKEWCGKNIKYNFKNIFEENNKYDVVVANELIEHIKDIKLLFKKFKQITKRCLIFTSPSPATPMWCGWHWKHYSLNEIKGFIQNIDFKLIRVKFMEYPFYVGIRK